MASIFEAYDEEFLALTQDISNNISHLTTYETNPGTVFFPTASDYFTVGRPAFSFDIS